MKMSIVEIVVPLSLWLALAAAPPAAGDRVSGVVRDGAYQELVPISATPTSGVGARSCGGKCMR